MGSRRGGEEVPVLRTLIGVPASFQMVSPHAVIRPACCSGRFPADLIGEMSRGERDILWDPMKLAAALADRGDGVRRSGYRKSPLTLCDLCFGSALSLHSETGGFRRRLGNSLASEADLGRGGHRAAWGGFDSQA